MTTSLLFRPSEGRPNARFRIWIGVWAGWAIAALLVLATIAFIAGFFTDHPTLLTQSTVRGGKVVDWSFWISLGLAAAVGQSMKPPWYKAVGNTLGLAFVTMALLMLLNYTVESSLEKRLFMSGDTQTSMESFRVVRIEKGRGGPYVRLHRSAYTMQPRISVDRATVDLLRDRIHEAPNGYPRAHAYRTSSDRCIRLTVEHNGDAARLPRRRATSRDFFECPLVRDEF